MDCVRFHFLKVGHGDCTIIHWPKRTQGEETIDERIMMVDIYHDENQKGCENVIEYYKANFKDDNGTIKPIFRLVCSHPHQDHICGLQQLCDDNEIEVLNFWDLDHSFVPNDFNGHPTHEEDWQAYEALRQSSSEPKVLKYTRETTPKPYWNDNGDRITILTPSKSLINKAHYNEDGSPKDQIEIDEMSYALSIRINDRSVILAGDGRNEPVWNDMYENCKDILKQCYVLKAGHHGHEASFHEDAVKLMAPLVIVLSNSKDDNEEYGAETLYEKVCPNAEIYKTWEGTVIVEVPFDSQKAIRIS